MYISMYIKGVTKTYSIAAARAALSTIVDEVEAGAEIELTKRGKPVAVVMSAQEYERLRGGRVAFGDALRAFMRRHDAGAIGLDQAFVRDLRDPSTGRKVRV
jgi:prevent-host-death family protein